MKDHKLLGLIALIISISVMVFTFYRYDSYNKKVIIEKLNSLDKTSAQIIGCDTIIISTNNSVISKFGANGFDEKEDTDDIQNVIDAAIPGESITIPYGIYYINPDKGIKLKSDITLINNGVLKALPSNQETFGIIKINNVSNVNIIGGIIEGERDKHLGTTGEWGMGIMIFSSSNILIKDVISKNNWGDGFYIGTQFDDNINIPNNVRLCSVISTNNRRQGLSITSGDTILVNRSIFRNTSGTPPSAGIDIEPNEGQTVKNVVITNSLFFDNYGGGINITYPFSLGTNASNVQNIIVQNNIITNNSCKEKDCSSEALLLSNTSGNRIINNIISDNAQDGISIVNGSKNNIIEGNISTKNGTIKNDYTGIGLLFYPEDSVNNIATKNIIYNNISDDIRSFGSNNIESNISK